MTEEVKEEKPKRAPRKSKYTPKKGIFIERNGSVIRCKKGVEVELTSEEAKPFKDIGAL